MWGKGIDLRKNSQITPLSHNAELNYVKKLLKKPSIKHFSVQHTIKIQTVDSKQISYLQWNHVCNKAIQNGKAPGADISLLTVLTVISHAEGVNIIWHSNNALQLHNQVYLLYTECIYFVECCINVKQGCELSLLLF